jgi:hypothetical protein
LLEEIFELTLPNKADTRAVFFVMGTQAQLLGYLAYTAFLKLADWKEGLCEAFAAYLAKKITLILIAI